MRTIDTFQHHRIHTPDCGPSGRAPVRARRLRPQLFTDAVIAAYIHDISVRHRREASRPGLTELRPRVA